MAFSEPMSNFRTLQVLHQWREAPMCMWVGRWHARRCRNDIDDHSWWELPHSDFTLVPNAYWPLGVKFPRN